MTTKAEIEVLQQLHGSKTLTVNQMLGKAQAVLDGDEQLVHYPRFPVYLMLREIIVRQFGAPPEQ